MAYDLRSPHAGDATHGGPAQGSSMVPGKRSAAAELSGANGIAPAGKSGPGQGGSQPLFAGAVEWEDLQGEDPVAKDEAQQPAADEAADAGAASEDGELDPDSDDGDEEAVAEPHAPEPHAGEAHAGEPHGPEAPASQPGHASTAGPHAPHGPTGHGAHAARSSQPQRGPREAGQPATARAAAAGKTYHVNRSYRDGPYGGTAKYDVRVTAKDITITVGIRLTPGSGVTAGQVTSVKNASQAIFKQKYDRRFKLTEIPYKPRPLRMELRFSHPSPQHKVALHKGGGRDDAANWFVKGDATTRAHEIGHLLGLKDEYTDSASPKRKVYTDNSLMGNYYTEGIKTASLKKRHGKVFAGDISRASGRKFYISS